MCLSLTSQVIVLCSLILPVVFGIFFWGLYEREVTFLRTFHSPGTDGLLAALVFPIEVITYFMRPISILCRLFANFMSGHVIFKVLLSGVYSYTTTTSGVLFAMFSVPFLLGLIPLIILEIAISCIQVYVFLVIFGMFLADSIGHHYRH
jgi:F-type H+-transporting ATPase subunit a